MEKYDYYASLQSSIECWLEERGYSAEILASGDYDYNDIYDEMFVSDSVTGNASGSYTFSTWKAEENICDNMDLLQDAIREFGISDPRLCDAEWCDVTIRCYLLASVLKAVLGSYQFEDYDCESVC